MTTTAAGDRLGDVLGRAADGWADAVHRFWGEPGADRRPGCRCPGSCGCGDPCACCVPHADLVVHATTGERRLVAFALRNPRHREREVSLEVGPWHSCGGEDLDVRATWDTASPLVLGSCERRVVRLGLEVAVPGKRENGQGDDVESCASAYADVRFEGCARPRRVAVVVHPAACDALDVTCDCGCC